MYTRTIGILGKCYIGQLPTKVEEELNWFKTLKERIGGISYDDNRKIYNKYDNSGLYLEAVL